ncbi:MAG: chemotaxis-specific protein-glutamate methyltransferase CheB [Lachnospiraceae bacterium]|nr:chemotaxis-specific protein-glutamate methyltransferase CheB [Lachnospiraceae bacterium]
MKKNILIVDDSALMRRVESDIINSDERFQATESAVDGLEAFDLVTRNPSKYDAIILDINMPRMTGLEFLEAINRVRVKAKIIIVSTLATEGADETIRALELGAFDYVTKPGSFLDAMGSSFRKHLLLALAYATNVVEDHDAEMVNINKEATIKPQGPSTVTRPSTPSPLVKPSKEREKEPLAPIATLHKATESHASPMNPRAILAEGIVKRRPHKTVSGNAKRLIVIASSTGGPKALQSVIPKLPKNINAPILLVQHMSGGFTLSLAKRLNDLSQVDVVEVQGGERLKKGVVYLAKGGAQMRLRKKGQDYELELNTEEPARAGLKPCADILFESISELDFDDITCIVLTGMGGDGTLGIKRLNEKFNIYVIAQDEQTSTVYGMPKVLYEVGLTDVVKPLDQIAEEITKNAGVQ